MKKQIGLVVSAALLTVIYMVPPASAKTAKECTAEWRADKAGMQARGMTEKAYVDSCKGDPAAPTTAPATPSAAAPAPAPPPLSTAAPKAAAGAANQKTAKECTAEWRADKAGMQARGMTEKAYVDQCRSGAEPAAAAPIAPKPSVAAPAPPPAAAPASKNQRPAPLNPAPVARQPSTGSATTSQSGEYADEAQAKAHCPGDTVVWANLSSKVYHFAGSKTYGNTKHGAYMCEREAETAQFRASKNEKHP